VVIVAGPASAGHTPCVQNSGLRFRFMVYGLFRLGLASAGHILVSRFGFQVRFRVQGPGFRFSGINRWNSDATARRGAMVSGSRFRVLNRGDMSEPDVMRVYGFGFRFPGSGLIYMVEGVEYEPVGR